MQTNKIRKMTITAMLTAISIALYFIAEIPIIPGVPHLKIDLSDIPALIAAIILGPFSGIAVEFLKNVIHVMRTATFGIGELANFVVGISLILPVGMIYNKLRVKHQRAKAMLFASLIGAVSIVVGGLAINALVYPLFVKLMGGVIETPQIYFAYLWSTVPMNLIKTVVTVIPALPLTYVLEKAKLGKSLE